MATESTLRYIKLDYQSHKDALSQRIRDRWPSAWNDFLSNSIGMVLIDVVAWGLATLAFLVNRTGSEAYVPTMSLRETAVRIGGLTAYQLRGPTPATVSCEATLSSVQAADVTIQKGTLIRSSDASAVAFEVVQDYTIEAGNLTPLTLIVTFSPAMTGTKVINSYVTVTSGAVEADCVDTTIDLSAYVSVGQSFNVIGSTDIYTIQSLENAPGAVAQFTRMVLDRPFVGTTASVSAEVYDRRIQLVQGQTVTERFVAPAGDTSGFSVKLSKTPVIDDSVSAAVNGETWEQVAVLGLQEAFSSVYQVKTLPTGTTVVLFGDNEFGLAVPSESAVAVSYRIGGGVDGNVALNSINTSITGLNTSLSNPVPVTIQNTTSSGVGGQDAETLDQARVNIPANTRTNDRAVTLEDYQTIAMQYSDAQLGSVAYARSTVRTENSYLEGNIVVIYAWTTGTSGGLVNLPPQLKQSLGTYMQTKAVGTDLVQIYDGTSRPVPISLRFKVFQGFSISDTDRVVNGTIQTFINALRPGDTILYSNLVRALDEAYGVDTVNMATPITDLTPSNSTELFTVPQDTFVYDISRQSGGSPAPDTNGVNVSLYTAQLPIFPLAAWSFRLFLGTDELTIVPDAVPGYARLLGSNLSAENPSASASANAAFMSKVNLLTGQVSLYLVGAPGDLTMKLVSVQGYSSERVVNLYIGYTGENTQSKRREIRSALRSYSDGLQVGGALYAESVSNVVASTVAVKDVVVNVEGVDSVTRVALDSPASSDNRVTAADYELLKIGNIYLNNQVD